MFSEQTYDVIVVGSGVGGCGAAALLAKDHGKKVLVLEKAPHIGGRVYVRFELKSEPLARQWYRSLRQLLLGKFYV